MVTESCEGHGKKSQNVARIGYLLAVPKNVLTAQGIKLQAYERDNTGAT